MKSNRVPDIRYRTLEHTADIRLRIYGKTIRQLFQNAAYALTDSLTDARRVRSRRFRRIRLRSDSIEHLLVLLLKEILFLFDTRRFLCRRLVIERFGDTILHGRLCGEPAKGHRLKTEIKAVTYHRLKVEKRRGRWIAEVILDV